MKTTLCLLNVGLISILGLFTTGCAFGTRHATLVYPPHPSPYKEAITTSNAPAMGTVGIGEFSDERSNKEVIGHVRNGYGMKTAEVRLKSEVPHFVADAFRYEFQKAGWEVVDATTAAANHHPVISGEVLVLRCDAYLSYEGEATILVRASRDGLEIFKKAYTQNGGGGMNWASTGESYGRVVSSAIQEVIVRFIDDMPVVLKSEAVATKQE